MVLGLTEGDRGCKQHSFTNSILKGNSGKEGEGGGGLDEEISGWFVSFIVNYETKACNCSVPLIIQLHIHAITRRKENNQ